ncbi:MAG: NAD(P)/FAD-dependent oxidoreductase [Nitrospira sp.]|nr:NAD(P)/FAD-dependent oxidoreductase [Nitrospira sp.]
MDGFAACDIAVVGAGAAGLSAAIVAGERAAGRALNIVLLDGAKTIGAKILVSGGGRCNVTHDTVTPTDYFGNRRIIKNVLASRSVEDTIQWFASMGVMLKREDTGKLFPVTDTARTVLTALLTRCRNLGMTIRPSHRVTRIDTSADTGFLLQHSQGVLQARHVILATGGRSVPKSGSDGFGYDLAHRLGHTITTTVPALVPLVLDTRLFHRSLSGLSQEVELTTWVDGHTIDTRTGSLLWTHFGISGPVAMDASRFWTLAHARGEKALVSANFLPGLTQEEARDWFIHEAAHHPRRSLANALASRVPERLAEVLCTHAACNPQQAIAQVCRADRERLIAALTKLVLPIERDRGWNYAEVTAGGVPLEEINYRTMESKLVPGLYLIGELLDCDGRIGGFNFQWAWTTGFLAGRAVADR